MDLTRISVYCMPYPETHNSRSIQLKLVEDLRRYDDHMNVNTSGFPSVRIGESIGTQSNHGFSYFLELRSDIKSTTACLGRRSPGFAESYHDLIGIKLEYFFAPRHHSVHALLGRCSEFGPTFELPAADRIFKVQVGLIHEGYSMELRTVNEIVFTTRQGVVKCFRGSTIIDSNTSGDHHLAVESSDCLQLIGLAWSFDLRQSLATDHGIQPHYTLH